jgi:hypothetical protein
MTRPLTIDLDSPDPTNAINAFLWNMNKARALGFTPPNKWTIAEHFLRDDVSLVFYGAGGGTIVLGADEVALDDKESWAFVMQLIERVTERRKAKREAESAAAPPPTEAAPHDEAERALPIMPRQKGGLSRAAQKANV